jgi:hypothetical protein
MSSIMNEHIFHEIQNNISTRFSLYKNIQHDINYGLVVDNSLHSALVKQMEFDIQWYIHVFCHIDELDAIDEIIKLDLYEKFYTNVFDLWGE